MTDGLIDLELFVKELDSLVEREDGYRLVHVGRHQETELSAPVEEFALGRLPGPMILFELTVKDEEGNLDRNEALQLASLCKQSRDKLAGRPETRLWVPGPPEVAL